ncbi:hypothetical protein BSPLISOX_1573 [uncultured Gammaproteobacteria bacterium]|nr:hypothetical protein [uncultured Gammaproteobacteria bacterium]CAC9464257.1 hypothetical protein [uncultured Gammaproteobacteria bacterium]VVH64340.1 hypothetical protein BSPLISOX_1573 [uncultured Gammaproteobacteria bacterium]
MAQTTKRKTVNHGKKHLKNYHTLDKLSSRIKTLNKIQNESNIF